MKCEWEDVGRDMDGSWRGFLCNREATHVITDDGDTDWNFCDEHAVKAAEEVKE